MFREVKQDVFIFFSSTEKRNFKIKMHFQLGNYLELIKLFRVRTPENVFQLFQLHLKRQNITKTVIVKQNIYLGCLYQSVKPTTARSPLLVRWMVRITEVVMLYVFKTIYMFLAPLLQYNRLPITRKVYFKFQDITNLIYGFVKLNMNISSTTNLC